MNLTKFLGVIVLLSSSILELSEAGKKNRDPTRANRERKPRKNKKTKRESESTDGSNPGVDEDLDVDLGSGQSRDCGRTPNSVLKLQLEALATRQERESRVFVAPAVGGGAHELPHAREELINDGPSSGGCHERRFRVTDENRFPRRITEVECVCKGCGPVGMETARCRPIVYEMDVLLRNESEPCFQGLMQYEKASIVVTVGCVYQPIH